MSQPLGSGNGDFQRTPIEVLRHGLGQDDPKHWSGYASAGLAAAAEVFRYPKRAPEFYKKVADGSLALALACTDYNETETGKARGGEQTMDEARIKVLGINSLAAALLKSRQEAVRKALRELDLTTLSDYLPAADEVLSRPQEIRDQILHGLGEHRPLRGMFDGVRSVWPEAVAVTRDPRGSSGQSGVVWGNQAPNKQEDKKRGVLFGAGYDGLLVATATLLGYSVEPVDETQAKTPAREVIRLHPKPWPKEALPPATPSDIYEYVKESQPPKLGIDIAKGRDDARRDGGSAVAALEQDVPALHAIFEAVTKGVGAYTGLDMSQEGIDTGAGAIALAYANTNSKRLKEVLQSLDSLAPNGLRGSDLLKRAVAAACERAETTVEAIRDKNQDLNRGMEGLDGLKSRAIQIDPYELTIEDAVPLFAGVSKAVNGSVQQYAARNNGPTEDKKYNGYLAAGQAFNEILCELLETIPDPNEEKQPERKTA